MEYVILGLLIIKSHTLYELNKSFTQGISLFYSASYGSLKTTLKKLLEKGFIMFEEKKQNSRIKKVYRITDSGKEAFFEWMKADIPINKLEVTALLKVYFLGLIECRKEKKEILMKIINKMNLAEEELLRLNEKLVKYEVPESYKEVYYYQIKTLDYGIKSYDFAKRWIEEVLISLK